MQGDKQVIDLLNDVLTAELTAINAYFLSARMMKQWGFDRLGAYYRKESIDEMKHAEALMDRILFLEGMPNVQRLGKVWVGENVEEQMKLDLDEEYKAAKRLNDGIAVCREKGDNGTEDLLVQILKSEEEHIDWLETQLSLFKSLGATGYLAEQMKD
jgi:bacterioferritin